MLGGCVDRTWKHIISGINPIEAKTDVDRGSEDLHVDMNDIDIDIECAYI